MSEELGKLTNEIEKMLKTKRAYRYVITALYDRYFDKYKATAKEKFCLEYEGG